MTSSRNPLEGLLEICDQIRELQAKHSGGALQPEAAATHERVRALRDTLFAALPALHSHPRAATLRDSEVLALALLLHRRLAGRNEAAAGSELVALLRQAGFTRSEGLEILAPEGPLRRDGWLFAKTKLRGFDPLDTWFSATPAALGLFWTRGPVLSAESQAPRHAPRAYRSEEDCLWDLFDWRQICLQRADALFPSDAGSAESSGHLHELQREARAALLRIRERLQLTQGGDSFQVEVLRREHKLGPDHMLLMAHLLFCELVEGEPFISAVEGLRVVAETRSDLFRKRRLVSPRGKLRRSGIVIAAESGEYNKELASDLSLADWATEELLKGMRRPPQFDDRELDEFLRGNE